MRTRGVGLNCEAYGFNGYADMVARVCKRQFQVGGAISSHQEFLEQFPSVVVTSNLHPCRRFWLELVTSVYNASDPVVYCCLV